MADAPPATEQPPPRRRRWLRTFDALGAPAYRNYFIAMLFYFGAMQATVLVRPILAF